MNQISNKFKNFLAASVTESNYYQIKSSASTVNLSFAINPLGCSELVKNYFKQNELNISNYPTRDASELIEKLALLNKLSFENFCIGAGIVNLLRTLFYGLVNFGDLILIQAHSFFVFEYLALGFEAKYNFTVSNIDFDIDYYATEKLLKTGDYKICVLCNPNNPTGISLNFEKIEAWVKKFKQTFFIIDEANIEFGGTSCISLVQNYNNIIVLRTFSKFYGLANLRIGYFVAAQSLVQYFKLLFYNFEFSSLSMDSASLALNDSEFIKKSFNFVQSQRKFLEAELSKLNFKFLKSDANYLCIKTPEQFKNSTQFTAYLKNKNCAVVDGAFFGGLENYIRISPRSIATNLEFIALLKQVI